MILPINSLAPIGADFDPAAAAAALRHAQQTALTAIAVWFAVRPPTYRLPAPDGPELRYALHSQLRYLDAAGFAFESGDERQAEHHPYWLLDAEDVLLCLDLLAAAGAVNRAG